MKGLKTEFCEDVTIVNLMRLNETIGMTVELNDGQITGVNFEGETDEA